MTMGAKGRRSAPMPQFARHHLLCDGAEPMGKPAARITDMHTCPMVTGIVPHVGGPIVTGFPTVITGGMPQARITDVCVCVGPPDVIITGAFTVIVGGQPAARIADTTAHGGVIVTGWPTVLIGDEGGGGGGGGGGSNTDTPAVEVLASGPGMSSPGEQAAALVAAAKSGKPFCKRCFEQALARAAKKHT